MLKINHKRGLGQIRIILRLVAVDKTNLQDFEQLRFLGKGRYGEVWQVRHKTTGHIYAMKAMRKVDVIRDTSIKLLENERNILIQIMHNPFPYLVQLYYAFQSHNKLYFVLSFAGGGGMYEKLKEKGRFTEDEARFCIAEITHVLDRLHETGIVHRDLKPENVLFDDEGQVVLADFGLSKPNVDEQQPLLTVCGTPYYIAPEILLKKTIS